MEAACRRGPGDYCQLLLAFAIDAWWENRLEARGERWLLERLQKDFAEIAHDLEIAYLDHQATADACLALLELSAATPTLPRTHEVDVMLGHVFLVSRTFNPGAGSVELFLNGDTSRLVRNQSLADLLIRWTALVDELVEEEAQMQKGVAERWTPFLGSRIDLSAVLARRDPVFADIPQDTEASAERPSIIADTAFRNEILDRYKWQLLTLRDIAPLQQTVREIRQLLREELGPL